MRRPSRRPSARLSRGSLSRGSSGDDGYDPRQKSSPVPPAFHEKKPRPTVHRETSTDELLERVRNGKQLRYEERSSASQLVNIQTRLAEKKSNERRVFVKRIGGAALVALALAVLIWLLFFSAVFRFSLERTHLNGVGGSSIIRHEDVQGVLARFEGQPLILLDTVELENELEAIAEVADAHAYVRFPRTMVVEFTPHTPFMCVGEPGDCQAFAADGSPLRVEQANLGGVPILRIESAGIAAQEAMAAMSDVYEQLDVSLRKKITSYELSSSKQVSFILDTGATVRWGTADQPELKGKVLSALLQEKHSLYDVSQPTAPVTQ